MKLKRLFVILILAVILALTLAACDPKPEDAPKNTVTVTFKTDGGDTVVTLEEGAAIATSDIPPAPSGHDGEIFDGWFVGDQKVDGGYVPTEPVVATPKFSAPKRMFTIRFSLGEYDGDGEAPDPITVEAGSRVTLPYPDVEFDGHAFVCWSVGTATFAGGETITLNNSFDLTAVWKTAPCTVTFYLGEEYTGSLTAPDPVQVDRGASYAPASLGEEYDFDGYMFFGWTISGSDGSEVYNEKNPITVTSDVTLEAVWIGIEVGFYQYVNLFSGWSLTGIILYGNGTGEFYEDSTADDYVEFTYVFDYENLVGTVTFDPESEVEDFKFQLVALRTGAGSEIFYIVYDETFDGTMHDEKGGTFRSDGFMSATYTRAADGATLSGTYASWKDYVFFTHNGALTTFVYDSASNSLTEVADVFFLDTTDADTQLVFESEHEAYLKAGSAKYPGTVEGEFNDDGEIKSVFASEDGQHTFDFSANKTTGLFTKTYDISGTYTLVNDSWQKLSDYTFNFYTGYNGGQVAVFDDGFSYVTSGTYAITDKDSLVYTITLVMPIDLNDGKTGVSTFDIFIENEGDEPYAVVINEDNKNLLLLASDPTIYVKLFGNGRGVWSTDYNFATDNHMMLYGFFSDDFGYYVYLDQDGNNAEMQFHVTYDLGYAKMIEFIDTSADRYKAIYGTYYSTSDFNRQFRVGADCTFLDNAGCPYILSDGGTYFTLYVIDDNGFYTPHRVDISGENLTIDGEVFSKNFQKEVTVTGHGLTLSFNVVQLEKNLAGYTVAPVSVNGEDSELYFGYYKVGSEQYNNVSYSWYLGFYVELTAGEVFMRFEVSVNLDPVTFESTNDEDIVFTLLEKDEDEVATFYETSDGDELYFDSRLSDSFNGVLCFDSEGNLTIGLWSVDGNAFTVKTKDGETLLTFTIPS